jgi:hypothetical protein
VPQDIFLLDSGIATNIAFGINAWEMDMTAVEQSAPYRTVARLCNPGIAKGV